MKQKEKYVKISSSALPRTWILVPAGADAEQYVEEYLERLKQSAEKVKGRGKKTKGNTKYYVSQKTK